MIDWTDGDAIAGGQRGGEKDDQAEMSHIAILSRTFI